MITVDRSPKQNYLRETIENLARSGVFTSERLQSFTLVVGDKVIPYASLKIDTPISEYDAYVSSRLYYDHAVISADHRLLPCENAGRALVVGSKLASCKPNSAGWVLFLEDDIDVCADFLGSVGRWLDRRADNTFDALYSFGCPYAQVREEGDWFTPFRPETWQYSPFAFYGTQAIVMRPTYARLLGTMISAYPALAHHSDSDITDPKQRRMLLSSEYDLMIGHFCAVNGYNNICASAPSFIQHIGVESSLSDRKTCHTFPSWPGREWSYR